MRATNEDFLCGLSMEGLESSFTDLFGLKVSEDLRFELLLSGVETPEDPLKTTSLMLSGGEVTPLEGDLDLSLNLEL